MKTLLLSLLATAAFSSSTFAAESTVTLNFKNITLTSQDSGAAMIDLTNEIRKQSPQTNISGLRIKSAVITGQPSFLGATVVLLVSGQAIDSQTADSSVQTLNLSTNLPNTPAPWVLAVRGQMSLQQVKLTLDAQLSDAPLQSSPVTQQPNPTDSQPTAPVSKSPFAVGEKVIAVSSSSGIIDYVTFAGADGNGFYTVTYQGTNYDGWSLDQLAKTSGCSANICVGKHVNYRGQDLTVIGLLSNGDFVMDNSFKEEKTVLTKEDLASADSLPGVVIPTPMPAPRSRFHVGENIYYVDNGNRVASVTVNRIRSDGSVDIEMNDRLYTIKNTAQLGQKRACAGNSFCTGDQVTAISRDGRGYRATIMGVQSDRMVIVSFAGQNGLVGNWPVSYLRR